MEASFHYKHGFPKSITCKLYACVSTVTRLIVYTVWQVELACDGFRKVYLPINFLIWCVWGTELACLQAALSTSALNFPMSLSTLVETQDELAQAWNLLVSDETTANLVWNLSSGRSCQVALICHAAPLLNSLKLQVTFIAKSVLKMASCI